MLEGIDEIYDGMVAFCERGGRMKAFEEFNSVSHVLNRLDYACWIAKMVAKSQAV